MLAAKAPSLREALETATGLGLPYLILEGTLVDGAVVGGQDFNTR